MSRMQSPMDVYKRLLQFAADYRGLLLSAAAGALLEGVAGGAFLAMMKPVIEGRTLQALDLQPSDEVLIGRAVDQPIPGSVVLQHDIHPNTGRTAGRVYDGLLDRGFVLVNLQQLYNGQLPVSGARSSGR